MALLSQQGRLVLWAPVLFAVGIGVFFMLRFEPPVVLVAMSGGLALASAVSAARSDVLRGALLWAVALTLLGFAAAGLRTHLVATPVIDGRYYGPVEGRVVGLDRSASGAIRVTLDQVRLARMDPAKVPRRVRVSLHGDIASETKPGTRVMTTAHLSAPNGPVEPHGFDFQRHAWFLSLGAVGYSRVPLLLVDVQTPRPSVFALRMALSEHVQSRITGPAGGFAAAITTGDRSGLTQEVTQSLRDTNLAHLLAISGLHMGLLTGFVFGALRLVLSLSPLGLRWPARKVAAACALSTGAVYLALSGGNVATERAFVMVAVALCAILINRRAISLRSVAAAALIILTFRPEALLSPGFQMSFAATVALVNAFQILTLSGVGQRSAIARPVLALFISAAVAGAATMPFAAAHFNRIASYGFVANLMAPPIMGLVVAPSGVAAALLAPIGLDWLGFWVMEQGLKAIIWISDTVAAWRDPVRQVPQPPVSVLPLISFGALWVILVLGRLRFAGLAPMAVAFVLWAQTERPAVLISATGTLVGVMTDDGRALSKTSGAGFVAQNWLENDGDGRSQADAAARWPLEEDGRIRVYPLNGGHLIHASGKRALAEVTSCARGDILVASVAVEKRWPCEIYDPARLRPIGSIALSLKEEGVEKTSARQISGARLWNDRETRAAFQ